MNILDGLSENLLGNIQKAQIRVLDTKNLSKANIEGESSVNEAVDVKTKNRSTITKIGNNYESWVFEVQFNPTELVLKGTGGGERPKTTYSKKQGGESGITYGAAPVNITLSVRLIFDHVVPGDAFTGATTTSLSAGIQRLSSVIDTKTSEKKRYDDAGILAVDQHSVRREVEALIGAIRGDDTRVINFSWGKHINYTGSLNSLNANYVMFNTNGEPIRAYVDMTVLLADSDQSDSAFFKISAEEWFAKYKAAFSENKSYVSKGESMGSLINWG